MSKHGYTAELADALYDIGEIIAHRMRDQVAEYHTRSGALRDSIRCESEYDDDGATVYVYADAKAKNGAMYAEFLEHGTGQYNDQGATSYPHGQKPTHFIKNAVDGVINNEMDPQDALGQPIGEMIQELIDEGLKNFVSSEVSMEILTLRYKR